MRIAMISVHSCPVGPLGTRDTGGMSVYIRELADELGRQGHTVDIYTRVHDFIEPEILPIGHGARVIHLKAGEEETLHRLAIYTMLPDYACNVESFRKEHGLEYDVIFSHYWLASFVGDYVRRWWRVPHVVMFHTLGALKAENGMAEDENDIRVMTERQIVSDCDYIIAATEQEQRYLKEYYGAGEGKIGIVPCGVNTAMFRTGDRDEARRELGIGNEPLLLFVGRIDPIKGIDRLLEAMSIVQHQQDVRLIIIGGESEDNHEMNRLRGLCTRLGLDDAIDFRGTIDHEQLPEYYRAADACVLSSYYESFGLVALEAMACGTPVIAPGVGALPQIVRENCTGTIVPDNMPGSLAEGIIRILSLVRDGSIEQQKISDSVRNFRWDYVACDIVRELRGILSAVKSRS